MVSNPEDTVPYRLPETCPSCGEVITRVEGEAAARCTNPQCPAQLMRNLIHFASRDAMDIDGLGPAALEQLSAALQVHSPADLYDITAQELETLDASAKRARKTSLRRSKNRKKTIYQSCCLRSAFRTSARRRQSCLRARSEIWML